MNCSCWDIRVMREKYKKPPSVFPWSQAASQMSEQTQQATAQHLTCLPESGARCSSASSNPRSSPTATDNRMPIPASIVIYQAKEKERGREMCEQSIAVRGYNRLASTTTTTTTTKANLRECRQETNAYLTESQGRNKQYSY